ncbi:hypothetical protein BDA99DRAFT_539317 [Phascolomyces articulosus]|uniref:Uncharacterized protein n=1 Tax=Phascolomyces articulosus TaxID=60185 RepID=A0AAD5PBQ4_9FUNG|nr:hypothetical protein BDA99DRAFT_539317 [Phascolomyces articulosus]
MVLLHFLDPNIFYGYNGAVIGLSAIAVIGVAAGLVRVLRNHKYIDRSLKTQCLRLYVTIFFAAICMTLSSTIPIAIDKVIDGQIIDGEAILPSYTAAHFFELIFPFLVVNVMLEGIRIASYPRVRYYSKEKKRNAFFMGHFLIYSTYILVVVDVIICIVIATGSTDNATFESIYGYFKFVLIPYLVFGIVQSMMMRTASSSDYQDFKISYHVMVVLPFIMSIGSIVVAVRNERVNSDYMVTFTLDTFIVKVVGLLILIFMDICFPMIWWPAISQAYENAVSPLEEIDINDYHGPSSLNEINKNNIDDSTQQLIDNSNNQYYHYNNDNRGK